MWVHPMISARHAVAVVADSVLSFRWLPFCLLGIHKTYSVPEVWGWRRFCERCGKTLEVGP